MADSADLGALGDLLNSTLNDFDDDEVEPVADATTSQLALGYDDITQKMLASLTKIEQTSAQSDPEVAILRQLIIESAQTRPQPKSSTPPTATPTTSTKTTQSPKDVIAKATKETFKTPTPQTQTAAPKKEKLGPKPARPRSSSVNLEDTLEQLMQNTNNISSEDEAMKLMEQMMKEMGGMDGGNPNPADMNDDQANGFINSMMENLLTKDVLYPSLKEISTEYPKWLDKNKAKLSAKAYADYESQYKLMKHMCVTYEDTSMSSSQQVKTVMVSFEEIQKFGSPPDEIMKTLGVQMGPDGMPLMPSPENCSIM